ncbi:MAG: Gfo/Idh/MocA family oxidoreductase [Phycisphaeraceae bacterium]|nr:Gfo/Idh/MocA family oxidoreductase [Phycisphaeraceae bacterium]
MTPPLRIGMVGGGKDSFIGGVHRMAMRLDDTASVVAGALSSSPERSRASGLGIGLDPDRAYGSWQEMLDGELSRDPADRIEAVSIVTPNNAHHAPATAFARAGFHVIVDKPLTSTLDDAIDLVRVIDHSGVVCCVTYNYSGYPMVRLAREMVAAGDLGDIRKVVVEYHQGWLAADLEGSGQKQASWRTDPARSGRGGAIGDIGSHAEHLARFITGLDIEAVSADLSTFVASRRLDDDASVLLRFAARGGVAARGVLTASQVCVGQENDLSIRIWGTRAGLMWRQEEPNHLVLRPDAAPERVYRRGNESLGAAAAWASRLPAGHPEAFIEAFANLYRAAAGEIRSRTTGGRLSGQASIERQFPTAVEGARGVEFIDRVVESSQRGGGWTPLRPVTGG